VVLKQINMVASVDSAVLVQGETGTGKEVIAQAIHEASPRRQNRFVALNCAAIPAALLESELFGHERGAFTGATVQTMGRFQSADRGTLFLDEIGDLPLELQPKLLRALQEKQFERLGSGRTFQVDVRVIAATNQDLWRMVQERRFRPDLYYRLNVFPITLPPLRERQDDIPALTETLRSKVCEAARQIHRSHLRGSNGDSEMPRLAGQRPRTPECHRARCNHDVGTRPRTANERAYATERRLGPNPNTPGR
jgi:formate hydrogenlyase transcriptional activator